MSPNTGYIIANMKTKIERLESSNAQMVFVLKVYMATFPAFRLKPIGAPNSDARKAQDEHIALEDRTRSIITRAGFSP